MTDQKIDSCAKWKTLEVFDPGAGEPAKLYYITDQLFFKFFFRMISRAIYTDIVEAVFAGIESDGLSIAKLTGQPIPEDWNEQRRLYGFPEG